MKRITTVFLMLSLILVSLAFPAIAEDYNWFFSENGSFEYQVMEDGTAVITGVFVSHETMVIPSEVDGIKVTRIGERAFYCCDCVYLTISEGITAFEDNAFVLCRQLERVNIPNSVVYIGENPFESCYNLKEIILSPDHPVLELVNGALIEKDIKCLLSCLYGLVEGPYDIPEGTRSIGPGAFHFCEGLTEIVIPASVQVIGRSAFSQCHNLEEVTIPEGVKTIGERAFESCTGLKRVSFPRSVEHMGELVFNSSNMRDVEYFAPSGSYAAQYLSEQGFEVHLTDE